MKKHLFLVGMLAIGYANAQEYEGRVGVNTEEPKATLDITAYKADGSTKEGLLIPRLTKVAVMKIASPEISTLVYVTDEVLESDNAKFQGIGKGFYFYNGTKWVKQLDSDNDTNTELWAQRTNGNITETYLKPADEKNTDLVAYLDNNGIRNWRLNIGDVQNGDLVYNGTTGVGFKIEEAIKGAFITSDAFPKQKVRNGAGNFYFNAVQGVVKDSHASGISKPHYYGNDSRVVVRDVNTALGTIYGSNSSVDVYSNNSIDGVYGANMIATFGSDAENLRPSGTNLVGGQMIARNYGTATNIYGGRFYARNYGTADHLRGVYAVTDSQSTVGGTNAEHTVNTVRGIQNYTNLNDNGTLKGYIWGMHNAVYVGNNTKFEGSAGVRGIYSRIDVRETEHTNTIINYASIFNPIGSTITRFEDFTSYPIIGANTKITDLVGFRAGGGSIDATASVENHYGIQIANITRGAEKNFAIHTGAKGIVHIGDKLGVGTEMPTQRIEANGNIFANNGGLISSLDSSVGGFVELRNPGKEGKGTNRWRIYNMNELDEYNYVPGIHFWSYQDGDEGVSGSRMILTDEGNLGVGFASRVSNSGLLGEKFEVNGNIRAVGLKGKGNRNVYADENGVLKVGDAADTQAGKVASSSGVQCTEENRGTMNFGRVSINGKETDAIGFCMKNSDNQFRWYYIYGGASHTVGTSAEFGTGL